MPDTALQVFDCPLRGATLIEAAAGTGKTWNICGLYLRLLLESGLEVPRILVVTFTKAATAELRERIRARIRETLGRLRGAAPNPSDEFVEHLLKTLRGRHGFADPDMERRLDEALQSFDEAAIFTIHGFCERALRDLPFGAGMPLAMELIEDDAALRLEVASDFWRRRVAAGAAVPGLAGLLLSKKDSPQKFARMLQRQASHPLMQLRWPDDIDAGPDAAAGNNPEFAALASAHAAARVSWLRDRDAIVACVNAGLDCLKANIYHAESVKTAVASWDQLLEAIDPFAASDDLEKLDLLSRERLKPKKGRMLPADHGFFDLAKELLAHRQVVRARVAGTRLQLLRDLLGDCPQVLRDMKRKRRVVGFDDILYNLHERLAGGQYPWLAPLLHARFPAALIDEFQDTDPLQLGIFRRIYGSTDAPLFLVGDPKQAIYSFRSADLHVYLAARRAAQRLYTLVENQRSSASLLRGLNALFGSRPGLFMLDDVGYAPLAYGRKPRRPFVDQTLQRAALQLWSLPPDSGGDPLYKDEARARAAAACAAEIARLLAGAAQGYITYGDVPLGGGDIAVLVRTHSEGRLMRDELAARGVGSVELSQRSVFESAEASELERILAAILEPARVAILRAACATVLLGGDSARIESLAADDGDILDRVARFDAYRDEWLRNGVGVMLRSLLREERIPQRLLALQFGERRLTNLLHLGELLQAAGTRDTTPEVLLGWLQLQLAGESSDDSAQLRLESDRNLVQIVTIHRAKGLEYPVVLCPFLWDGHRGGEQNRLDGCEYHDDTGTLVLDFRELAGAEKEAVDRRIALDRIAERVRLIYVALTRAVHRCYLVVGSYRERLGKNGSTTQACRGPLPWLVAGAGMSPWQWLQGTQGPADIEAAWADLAARGAPDIDYAPLPAVDAAAVTATPPARESVAVLAAPAHIPTGWRVGSYSQLIMGAGSGASAIDHDLRVLAPDTADTDMAAGTDILRFPRGTTAGDCIHAVFEHADFTLAAGWARVIESALRAFPQVPRAGTAAEDLPAMLASMLADVVRTPLPSGFRLADVPRSRRLDELKFSMPAAHFTSQALRRVLAAHGMPMPALGFAALQGYLNGAIDLVVETGGRFWLVDWKSNYLGTNALHYSAAALREAMQQHHYQLQCLLYSVGLHRYLQRRLRNYDYEAHFGGALYVFVRGVRPAWVGADGIATGVHFARPDARLVGALSALL